MAVKACLLRRPDGAFIPATQADAELLESCKVGKSYTVEVKQNSDRSYQHHKLFFGGLLPLAYEYWRPTGGMVRKSEQDAVHWVVRRICQVSGADGKAMMGFADAALQELAVKRGEKYGAAAQSLAAFREWLTIEAGWFDIVETPAGVVKRAKSIAFANMGQEAFNRFYKDCFAVAWNLMLSAVFDSEEAAQQAAVEKMMEMG